MEVYPAFLEIPIDKVISPTVPVPRINGFGQRTIVRLGCPSVLTLPAPDESADIR